MQEKDFVSYDYRTVTIKAHEQTKAMDMYEAFGWEIMASSHTGFDGMTLSLKRNRKQRHKSELVKLERQAEAALDTIHDLERAKTLGASVFAYVFGSVSVLALGGGMCLSMLATDNIPAMIGGVFLGCIGIVSCCFNYFLYKRFVNKKTRSLLSVIDQAEEKLANILEKGNDLLSTEQL